jgi:hypothetical protein
MTALMAAASFQNARLKHRNSLYRCSSQRGELNEVNRLPAMANRPLFSFTEPPPPPKVALDHCSKQLAHYKCLWIQIQGNFRAVSTIFLGFI